MEGRGPGPRIGLAVAQYGPFADPASAATVAEAAERLGFDSLWVGDRLFSPRSPQDGYGGGDNPWPVAMRRFLDPLTTLAIAAARTSRVRLGSHVLVAPLYPALALARSLTAIDLLSGGRLDVGLGSGWSRDEFAAAGVPWRERGARLEETLDVLEGAWADGPIDHSGAVGRIVPSEIEPKPAQRPRPPIYLGGWAEPALDRAARRADGWLPAGMPPAALLRSWARLRDAAARHGRDPEALRLVYRDNLTGTVEQLVEHLRGIVAAGVHEVLFDLNQAARDLPEFLDLAARVLEALRAAVPGVRS